MENFKKIDSASAASSQAFAVAFTVASALEKALGTVIRGRLDTIRLVLCALFADGHVLLEDYPGSGKTTLTKALGRLIKFPADQSVPTYLAPFRRIQFTPDLLPGDVLGVNVFDQKSSQFHFVFGPVFAHVVLADEINRTGPKVQAAFLECMAEKQVTIENTTYPLDEVFFVVGTQNPLDIAGTYPLPLVQLDRFLLKVPMGYVDKKTEIEILEDHQKIEDNFNSTQPVCLREEIIVARSAVKEVHVAPAMREAIVAIVQATRGHPLLSHGASTRAALMLQSALQAWAVVNGRDYVAEDDLKFLAPYVLGHRLRFLGGKGESEKALKELMSPHLEALVGRAMRS